ncbi:MAG: flippase-like domain-containing protein, partial [Thermomicrobiales bacterium]|nr:flippase-like domain-containing protein [Thermomicrobiales bacterium]
GVSVAIWLTEGFRFWFVAISLDAGIPFAAAMFIAMMGSLLTALPITPAGLGVVEAGTTAVMVGVLGMNPALAISIVLLDRVVAYWLLIAIGLALYLRRFGRETRRASAAA